MKLMIEIPEAFEGHFSQDRFKDSLERILEGCKHSAILSGIYEFETIEMLIRAFENGTPLPKGHGRLGDLDALEKEIINGIKAGNYEEGYETFAHINNMDDCVDCVRYAPTIIESEGGGGNDDND